MDPLLEPISDDAPCGVDLSYDIVYNDLAVLIQGTPENQFEENSAKEPSWPPIRKMAEEALKKSKDLQIAVYWAVALSQTGGMAGAARGMEVIAGMTRQYWDTVFPQLDPDDKDPTQRVNIISQLTVEPGGYGDPIKFIDRLNTAPIFIAPGLGPLSIDLITKEGGIGAARLPEIAAGSNPEDVAAGIASLQSVLNSVHALDDFLVATVGRTNAPSFDPLIKALDKAVRLFEGIGGVGESAAGQATVGEEAAAITPTGSAKKAAISGEIQSAEDVRKLIKKICDYYAANEPSSPVPILLQRANALIGMDFLSLLDNLTPSGKSALDALVGPQT